MSPRYKYLVGLIALTVILSTDAAFSYDSRMELFEGGNVAGLISLRSSLLSGAGIEGASSGFTAPLKLEPFIIFGNPAALGLIEGRAFALSSSPALGLNVTNFYDPSPTVQNSIDNSTQNFEMAARKIYPEVTGEILRNGAIVTGFAASFSLDEMDEEWFGGKLPRLVDRIAFGYQQPLEMGFKLIYAGLRTRIRSIEANPEDAILMFASINMDMDISISSHAWTFGGAKQIGDWWVGASLLRTDAIFQMNANQRTDGIMSKAGSESAFNDPRDPWANDFFSVANGEFDGAAWALRLGALYPYAEKWLFGADLRLQSPISMEGEFDIQLHRFTALKLNAQEDEEQFNVSNIDPTELTRTTPKMFTPSKKMTANIPSQLSIAASMRSLFKPSITLTKYFGELSYRYKMLEDGAPFVYKRGLKPNWAARGSLDIMLFNAGFGITSATDVNTGYKDASGQLIKTGNEIKLPYLALTFDASIADNMALGVLLVGLPEDFLRFTLQYKF